MSAPDATTPQPTTASFRGRPVPQWYDDAKLGIFIHWGIYSVPAWAPTSGPIWDPEPDAPKLAPFARNPYSEWYLNSMRIEGSPTRAHHASAHGADFPYADFAPVFNSAIEAWDPGEWASLFERAGAGYVVLTTKHHDGFLMWPSRHRNPHAPDYVASRNIVGELTTAVRDCGLRMGLYYSGGIDWLFHDQVIETGRDLFRALPPSPEYLAYATNHWRELIEVFEPCSMWNDIAFPGPLEKIEELFAFYYDHVPDGIVNDRFRHGVGPSGLGPILPHDVRTPEYTVVRDIASKKFESVRGIGNSFAFNRDEGPDEYLSARDLIHSFIDIVSKNGNLLINVGPRADGSIPEAQQSRLLALGQWLEIAGEAIRGTRPWERSSGQTTAGHALRFTRGPGAVYAIVLDEPDSRDLVLQGLGGLDPAVVELLGAPGRLEWDRSDAGLSVRLPETRPTSHALALKLRL